MINHPALILSGILLETCQGPQGVPFFVFCQPLSLASSIMISYQLPYPECFNNAIMIIIDALPIIHLQYSGKQCLWKYATAAPRSHSCIVFIFTLKQTAAEEPTDALQFWQKRVSDTKKCKQRKTESENEVFVTLNPQLTTQWLRIVKWREERSGKCNPLFIIDRHSLIQLWTHPKHICTQGWKLSDTVMLLTH